MRSLKSTLVTIISAVFIAASAVASEVESHNVGVGGYDLVSYQTSKKPLQGNANNVVRHKSVNYLFSSKENAEEFDANKNKYLPAFVATAPMARRLAISSSATRLYGKLLTASFT